MYIYDSEKNGIGGGKKLIDFTLKKQYDRENNGSNSKKKILYAHRHAASTLNIRCPQMVLALAEMSAINTNTSKLIVYQIMIVIHLKFKGSAELALRRQRHPRLLDGNVT